MNETTNTWCIEHMRPPDAERVAAFWQRMALEDERRSYPQAVQDGATACQRLLELEPMLGKIYNLLGACRSAGGEILGYASTVLIPKMDTRNGFVWVDELHVLTAARRLGCAQALLQATVEIARQHCFAGVRLAVRPSNEPARALYHRAGFHMTETGWAELRIK